MKVKILKRNKEDGLPEGISREYSPLFHFDQSPLLLIGAVLRYEAILNAIKEILKFDKVPNKNFTILDLGSGHGEMMRYLDCSWKARNTRIHYVGYEMDPWKLSSARSLFPSKKDCFIKADLRTFRNFPASDLGICQEVIEHFDRKYLSSFLGAIAKNCTWLVGTVPSPDYKRENKWHVNEMTSGEITTHLSKFFDIKYQGYLNTRFNRDMDGNWIPKCISRQYHGLKKMNPTSGTITFFVCKSKTKK